MILTKNEIIAAIKLGGLSFEPGIDAFQLQPHAIDLRLGFTYYIAKTWEITQRGRTSLSVDYLNNIANKNYFEIVQLNPGQYFEILPREYIIASTLESIHIKDLGLMGILFPRSSFNRRGLSVDLSGIIDTGYQGNLIIPIKNNTNDQTIRLYPGERICQVVFEQLASKLTQEEADLHGVHRAKYMGSDSNALSARPDKDEEKKFIIEGKIEDLKKNYNL
jgi:dCTP deaminase